VFEVGDMVELLVEGEDELVELVGSIAVPFVELYVEF